MDCVLPSAAVNKNSVCCGLTQVSCVRKGRPAEFISTQTPSTQCTSSKVGAAAERPKVWAAREPSRAPESAVAASGFASAGDSGGGGSFCTAPPASFRIFRACAASAASSASCSGKWLAAGATTAGEVACKVMGADSECCALCRLCACDSQAVCKAESTMSKGCALVMVSDERYPTASSTSCIKLLKPGDFTPENARLRWVISSSRRRAGCWLSLKKRASCRTSCRTAGSRFCTARCTGTSKCPSSAIVSTMRATISSDLVGAAGGAAYMLAPWV